MGRGDWGSPRPSGGAQQHSPHTDWNVNKPDFKQDPTEDGESGGEADYELGEVRRLHLVSGSGERQVSETLVSFTG